MRLGLTLFLLLASFRAQAYFQQDLLKSKRFTHVEGTQWTLADWLSQKNKMSLMDEWLAMHRSQSLFELDLSGQAEQFNLYTNRVGLRENGNLEQLNLFFSIFAVSGEYEKTSGNEESYAGAAGLRFLGSSTQTTSLTGRFGWHQRTDLTSGEQWQNQYGEALLQLYITGHFGLTGQCRYYLPANSNQGDSLSGFLYRAGVYAEAGMIRLQAEYFREPLRSVGTSSITSLLREGFMGGLKLFF